MHRVWKLVLLITLAATAVDRRALADPQPPANWQPTLLDDPVEPLVPLATRSESEDDHVKALALFAGGRVAEQKQDLARALFCYQRAFRLDPAATSVLREIVPLAFSLDRQAEGVRYALLMAERDASDPVLLRRLALYLSETGESARALDLYEKALVAQRQAGSTANLVMLHLEIGRLYFIEHKYERAAEHFLQVAQALNGPPDLDAATRRAVLGRPEITYQLFGEAFLETGRLAEAAGAFEKSHEAKADDALHAYNLARIDAKKKDFPAALDRLQIYFDKKQASRGTGPYQLLADVLAEQAQADQLLARLEKLQAEDPNNIPLAYFLANRYRLASQIERAEAAYLKLLENNKSRPPLEAYASLVDLYRAQHQPARLLEILGQAVERGGSLDTLGESGKALVADTDTIRVVLAVARERLANEPTKMNQGTLLAAAALAIDAGDFAFAGVLFDAAIRDNPGKVSETLVSWGIELFMAHQYAAAAAVFQRGLDEHVLPDDNPALHFYLAGALEMIGRSDAAIAAARRAAERQPDSARFQARPAWIEYHAKRNGDSLRDYKALLERFGKVQDPSEVRDVLREARLTMSNIAVTQGNLLEGEEYLEQVLDEFPDDAGALNDLGYLWADGNKHLARAHHMIRRAVEKEPGNLAYRDSLGWVFYRLGRANEAIVELRKAIEDEDPDAVVLDHLGDALAAAGQQAEALDLWRRALAGFAKRAEDQKAKATLDKILKEQAGDGKS